MSHKTLALVVVGVGLSLVSGGCLGGCPAEKLRVEFDPAALVVPSGKAVSVYASISGGTGPNEIDWDWSGPEEMGFADGASFTVSPPENFLGPKEYVIHVTVRDACGQEATAEKLVTIGGSPISNDDDDLVFDFDDGKLIITGGTWRNDGDIEVILGRRLKLDCSDFVKGGVRPFQYFWFDEDGHEIGHDAECEVSFDRAGRHSVVLRIIDARGRLIQIVIFIVVVEGDEEDPPQNPTIDLKVNGRDGTVEVEEGDQLEITWTSTNAKKVEVFSDPSTSKFRGERNTKTNTPELVTLPVGTWELGANAFGDPGTTSDTDTVTVTVCEAVDNCLRITKVTVSPNGPFTVGQSVVFKVETTGSGVLHFRLPTFTMNAADWSVDPSGTTCIPYTWPQKVWPNAPVPPATVGTPALAFFWPDDLNEEPYQFELPIVFQ